MKKIAQVIMLPTDKAENAILQFSTQLRYIDKYLPQEYIRAIGETSHHLYIVTDDEIKKGEKYLFRDDAEQRHIHTNNGDVAIQSSDRTKKIISTTDPELKLPQIPKSFIEEYCKAGGIDEVDVEWHYLDPEFIDKDGVYHCTTFTAKPFGEYVIPRVRVNSHNEIIIHPI